jgi:hypothetical protein
MAKRYGKLNVDSYRTFYVSRMYSSGTKILFQGNIKGLVNFMARIDKGKRGYYEAPIELTFLVGKIKTKKLSFKDLREGIERERAFKLTAEGKKFAEKYLNMKFKK